MIYFSKITIVLKYKLYDNDYHNHDYVIIYDNDLYILT